MYWFCNQKKKAHIKDSCVLVFFFLLKTFLISGYFSRSIHFWWKLLVHFPRPLYPTHPARQASRHYPWLALGLCPCQCLLLFPTPVQLLLAPAAPHRSPSFSVAFSLTEWLVEMVQVLGSALPGYVTLGKSLNLSEP